MSQRKNSDKRLLRVFLVGFMCSGKTTMGKLLAKRLGWEFVDVDEEIERREGMSIPEIFERKGEAYFRDLEMRVLKEISEREGIVVSTGGGLGANPEAMNYMKGKGKVVWLRVSFEEFLKRCGGDRSRPLLKRGEKKLRELLERREKVYGSADVTLEGGGPEDKVERLLSLL